MTPLVSIVLSCYNRVKQLRNTLESIRHQVGPRQEVIDPEIIVVEDGYDGGATESLAKTFGANYFRRNDRADLPKFQNPSRVHNIGIRRATGSIVILQGGEVKYDTPTGVLAMIAPVIYDGMTSTFALVKSLDEKGNFAEWYSHPREGERAGWKINFCQAVRRDALLTIGGFDETFAGYGGEDNDFEERLQMVGIKLQYAEQAMCSHQWHPRMGYGSIDFCGGSRVGYQANVGKEWGKL